MKNIIKTIDYSTLQNNIFAIKSELGNTKLCAVVKSNAYGHGLNQIAKTIENEVDYFAVIDNLEALKLRKITDAPIIVIGAFSQSYLSPALKHKIEQSVDNISQLNFLEKTSKKLNITTTVHIQLDTGLHRLGVSSKNELTKMLTFISHSPSLKLGSIYSHLSNGQDSNRTMTQLSRFTSLIPPTFTPSTHLFNTQYWRYARKLDMVRVGIGLYGYMHPHTQPILTIKARILKLVQVPKGEYIGYGNKHRAKSIQMVAIIGIGYADGLPYAWGKSGWVLYKDKKCPFVADICMNMSIVKATPDMKINDFVTILGTDKTQRISAQEIANHTGTIVDEVLTNFGSLRTN